MSSFIRLIKTLPFMILGVMMVTSSRYSNAKYGMIIVVGGLLYLWIASNFDKEEDEEPTA